MPAACSHTFHDHHLHNITRKDKQTNSLATKSRTKREKKKTKLTAMGLVQALRRSMKGEKEKQHSISITPKAAVAIVPPKKVR
jgi:hypothetical protein